MYLIITSREIYHEGDERSRQYPGHGYPAYSETVKHVEEFDGYGPFHKRVAQLTERKEQFKVYSAEPMKVTTTVEVKVE
jgi:hypothetical protein